MDKQQVIKYVKTAVIIIVVPSALVGAYYGYKYIKKKIEDKKNVKYYKATFPFKYQNDLFSNGQFVDAIKGVGGVLDSKVMSDDKNNPISIEVQISVLPSKLDKLKSILEGLNKEIKIEEKR